MLLFVATGYCNGPKYIFYFIGDGMGPSHVLGTELFLGEQQGVIGRPQKMCFTQFPNTAFVTTFSASNGVTDSAASGTALATGYKTRNARIGVDKDGNEVYSIAKDAKDAGMAVGIATTVCINHATPSAFYAHNENRNNYNDIAQWMLTAGYDFYAGGDAKCSDKEREELYSKAVEQGYTITRGYADYNVKADDAKKMMLYQKNIAEEIPYTIDRSDDDLTLAQITEAGIDFLYGKSKKGFFMMVEGGKIDYASHNDDAAAMFQEVMDFNSAIEVAYEFYKKHKDETLIVVTADHETGGIVLGYSGAYELNLKAMERQKVSVVRMTEILLAEKETTWGRVNALLEENMGTTADIKEEMDAKVTMDYNLAKKLSFEAMHKLNREALLSWASYNHSGTFVPLFAIGSGSGEFHGVIDNTDIPRIMRELKGFKE